MLMTVNSYLTNLANKLILSPTEVSSINTSIETLASRLDLYFGNNINTHYEFGSSTRGTILPRKADENSDIDYMIIFGTASGYMKPQTYLDRLRRFTNDRYPMSEIYQSHPTLVLSLNHIKFELVPAINHFWYGLQIPSPVSQWSDWMATNPKGLNQKLTSANTNNKSLIKPLIRLIKYWNACNDYPLNSYELENFVISANLYDDIALWLNFILCNSLADYFYAFWNAFSYPSNKAQYLRDKVAKTKQRVKYIKSCERSGNTPQAIIELQGLLPNL
jgi:hypothetical protein